MASPQLLVLAGGIGSRFGSHKQLAPVGPEGETLLEYSIFDALRAGFGSIVFLIRRAIEEEFTERLLSRLPRTVNYRIAYQEAESLVPPALARQRAKPWGTGHALLCAKDAIDGPFAIVNADDFYGAASFDLIGAALKAIPSESTSWSMVGYPLRNTTSIHGSVSRGICTIRDGFLVSIAEHRTIEHGKESLVSTFADRSLNLSGNEIVSMNLWGLSPAVFSIGSTLFEDFLARCANPAAEEFGLPDIMTHCIEKQRATIEVLTSPDRWHGLTYAQELPQVKQSIADLVRKGSYPSPLWS